MKTKGLAVVIVGVVFLLLGSGAVQAQEKTIAFHDSQNMAEALKPHMGQNVVLMLHSGKEIQGKLEKVGANLVLISKLTGKDFYDAVIRIDQIEGFQLKVRP
jgi:hypothetical protein